jgi:hypothetical protein
MRKLGDGDRTRPDHGSCRSKPAVTDHQLRSAATTKTPTPTATSTTPGWTRPFTHMTSKPVMLPPPPRREHRMRHWECAELHHLPDSVTPGFPEIVSSRRRAARCLRRTGDYGVRAPPSFDSLPIKPRLLTVGRTLPWDASMLPSSRVSRGPDSRDEDGAGLPYNRSGRVPFVVARPTDSPHSGR